MPLFGKGSAGKKIKIFYATDVHGSEKCFRKFLGAGKFYGVNALILGGDLTGKTIAPIIKQPDGTYTCKFMDQTRIMKSEEEIATQEEIIRSSGSYPYRTDVDQMNELAANPVKVDELFSELMLQTVQAWVKLTEEKMKDSGIKVYITGGNDDRQVIESVLKNSNYIIDPENEVVTLDDSHEMLSSGWSNPTPWQTPREEDEETLGNRLETLASRVKNMTTCIFNLHVPPKDTGIDTAAQLDATVSPPKPVMEGGEVKLFGAGSSAVKKLIEKHQPLLGLHGHIHESKGTVMLGRTLCINPGSEYGEGVLRGVLLTLEGDRVKNYQLTSG